MPHSKRAKRKAERLEKKMREAMEKVDQDTLEDLYGEVDVAAREIRGLRDLTTRDLAKVVSDDVLGCLAGLIEEYMSRDADHEMRLARLEGTLGLEEISDEEGEAYSSGDDPWSVDARRDVALRQVAPEALDAALEAAQAVLDCVIAGREPDDDIKLKAVGLKQMLEILSGPEEAEEEESKETEEEDSDE